MKKSKKKELAIIFLLFFGMAKNVQALTGIVNVNDSLSLRDQPTTSGSLLTRFYNATELTILDQNAGSGNGCAGPWYKVNYQNHTGYSCSDYIVLNREETPVYSGDDHSYSKENYQSKPSGDGSVMCYEDTGALGIRNGVNGSKTGKVLNCGDSVNILETIDRPNTTCPYWYKIDRSGDVGYVCGYFINTTKLSSTAENYYRNNPKGETKESYQKYLQEQGFPNSYIPYLLELHARHSNWNFTPEQINIKFDDAVNGEGIDGRNLLERKAFNDGYLSTASHTFDIVSNTFKGYTSEPGYYNASKEAIAYYLDPRNYLNEKYIFAFETLTYSLNQNRDVVSSILSSQNFWPSIYQYYNRPNAIKDSTGNVNDDIVDASSKVGISAVHVASRIKQEITGLSLSDSRIGGNFNYNGSSFANYYNFFNIKSGCTNCQSIYSGYAYEQGWNTPYKGIYGGASFMYNGYISINQDTIYYEKFDVSTTNGNYTHQYMQNLAAPIQEGGIKHKGYVNGLVSYLNTDITFVIPVFQDMPENTVTAPKLGNPNNYLKNLTINGSTINNFNYDTYNYNIYLPSNVTSIQVGASTFADTSKVNGTGSIGIQENEQTHQVKVVSENGKTRTYTIAIKRQTSEPITISEAMNHSGFKYNDHYLFGIEIGTNVSTLIGNITSYNNAVTVSIRSKEGAVKTNDSFRTGDKVSITGSDGTKEYEVVIFGDINGDGVVDKKDLLSMQGKVFGYSSLEGIKAAASDVNHDGTVDKKDLLSIQGQVFGYSKINQG